MRSQVQARMGIAALVIAAGLLPGCATTAAPPERAAPSLVLGRNASARAWGSVASAEDAARLERIGEAWTRALALAGQPRHDRRLTAEGALLRPDAAAPRAQLPPGSYHCRTFTFRDPARGRAALAVQGPHFCHVGADGPLLSFTKQTGPQRPGGYLYDDDDTRSVFIGAVAAGRERGPPAYRTRPGSDVVGIVERVGPFRYRLVVPWPRNGAVLEVLELKPAVQ